MDEEERVDLLREISLLADKIIVGDYLIPRPKGFDGFLGKPFEKEQIVQLMAELAGKNSAA